MKRLSRICVSLALAQCSFILVASPSLSQDVDVWTSLGLEGGRIYDIEIDLSDADKMFAAGDYGDGLFVTMNGGITWQGAEKCLNPPTDLTLQNQQVYMVKIAPSDPNVIWAAHIVSVSKSTDGGKTWTHIPNRTMQDPLEGACRNCPFLDWMRYCNAVAIDPYDPQRVFVGTSGRYLGFIPYGAIYMTENGGTTWKKLKGPVHDDFFLTDPRDPGNLDYEVYDIAVDGSNPDVTVVWAITSNRGIFAELAEPHDRVSDGTLFRGEIDRASGQVTWTEVFSMEGGQFFDLELKPDDPEVVFTANEWGIFRHYFENGEWKYQWILNFSGPEPSPGEVFARNVWALAFDPKNPDIVYAAWTNNISKWPDVDTRPKVGQGMPPYESKDWQIHTVDYQFQALAVHPQKSEVLFGGDRSMGIYKSRDQGQTWTPINHGINAIIVNDVQVDPNDPKHLLAGTTSGVYEKKGDGDWINTYSGLEVGAVAFDPTDPDGSTYYAGIPFHLAKTINSGAEWFLSDPISRAWRVEDIAIESNGNKVFTATFTRYYAGTIYKSDDGLATPALAEVLSSEKFCFNVVVIDPNDPEHVYAGAGNYYGDRVLGNLYESREGGDPGTWRLTGLRNEIVNALLIDPRDSNIMYAGCGYSGWATVPVYKSTDGGATWRPSFQGIPGMTLVMGQGSYNSVTDMAFGSGNPDSIYASTRWRGVYVSTNQAGNWANLGMTDYDVHAISTSSLYAGTQGGLLQCTGTGVVAGDITDETSGSGIDDATVASDLGTRCVSVDGKYMMVIPAGIGKVWATAAGYANKTIQNVTVYGGEVTWVDISMKSGLPDPSLHPGANDLTSSDEGGGYCFIASAAYGSPLARQVKILRRFRDAYLLPHQVGQRLIDLYYKTGGFAGKYIEAHPGLKRVTRPLLYPVVGIAWLIVSKGLLATALIGLSLMIFLLGPIYVFKATGFVNEKKR